MPPGLDALKHIVVLMMENRSFDHMLGAEVPWIGGIDDALLTSSAIRIQRARWSIRSRLRSFRAA
jgi:phospholipase C